MNAEQPQIKQAREELAACIGGAHGWDESCDQDADVYAATMARGGNNGKDGLRRQGLWQQLQTQYLPKSLF